MKTQTWEVGNIKITQIVELVDNELFSSFIPEAQPEKLLPIEWLSPHYLTPEGKLKAVVQTFLIDDGENLILVDTCNGNEKDRPEFLEWSNLETDFLEKFSALNIKIGKITHVLCTHMHFDHVGWNTVKQDGKWVPTFKNAKYLFSKEEYNYWKDEPENEVIDDHNGIKDSVKPIIEAGLAEFVSDDYKITENISFIPTPGHTPHHVSVMIESKGQKAIITGDVMHHPCQIAYPKWNTLADTYPEQTVETREKFLNDQLDSDTLIIGSHFHYPSAGFIQNWDGKMIFNPKI